MMTRATPAVLVLAAACSGTVPTTRYYQIPPPPPDPTAREAEGSVLSIERLASEGAYDDERIVYRVDAVRLDYYQYHRWSTAPGSMVTGYLQQALVHSGKFRSVVRDTTADTAAVLGGRVIAIEEVDESKTRWTAHIAVELTLADPRTGALVWSRAYDQREPLASQTPEGLAHALGIAMGRIAREATPTIAAQAERQSIARGRGSAQLGSAP